MVTLVYCVSMIGLFVVISVSGSISCILSCVLSFLRFNSFSISLLIVKTVFSYDTGSVILLCLGLVPSALMS